MANSIELLTVKQVCNTLKISIATLYRWEAEGRLPFPKIKIGPSAVRFRESDVLDHINKQIKPQSVTD